MDATIMAIDSAPGRGGVGAIVVGATVIVRARRSQMTALAGRTATVA